MNTSFQRTRRSDEWYTPPHIIAALGQFDLDPCAAPGWPTATRYYFKADNGLSKPWSGRVWLNPPYSHPLVEQFVRKMAAHNNGVALIFNRMDSALWHDIIFPTASAMLILRVASDSTGPTACRAMPPAAAQCSSPGVLPTPWRYNLPACPANLFS